MSCQALILRRRHTQQSSSAVPSATSAPQTAHLATLLALSGEMERLACSRISGATIGSTALIEGLRLINVFLTIAKKQVHYNTVLTCRYHAEFKPLPVPAEQAQRPAWTSTAGIFAREPRERSCLAARRRHPPCGCRWGNVHAL